MSCNVAAVICHPPYTVCSREHYLIYRGPTSLREPIYAESPAIPFTKRRMFEVKGMRSTYIVHESVAERLIALNANGLHIVPLLEWDMGFGFTI
ncbi:hypothetical protein [Shewanella algae]|uniref:hypothetical protein n=1 Tax=Shewanella algae TaxID=38313 RepID=UPI003AAED44B